MDKFDDTDDPVGSRPPVVRSPSAMPAPRQCRRLMELRRDPDLKPRGRNRDGMCLLSANSVTMLRPARHFGGP